MPRTTTNQPPNSEADFVSQIIALAKLCGWRCCHFRAARTVRGWRTPVQGDVGFPDLFLVHWKRRIALAIEAKTETGRTTADQEAWIHDLRAVGLDARVCRPSDWPAIEAILTGA